MSTPVENFAKVTVSIGYNAAAVSIALTAGHGTRLPSTFPYPLVWWNSTDYPDPADDPNREIVTVTARSGDTLTITRAAESTSASTKNTAAKTYKMALCITKAMFQELQARALSQSFRGLVVRTHPSEALRQSQVMFSADAIVMDDGEEVQAWDDVVADITASGAGGLDTGSEGASRWYEIWALYNGTTKSAVLHRALDYTTSAQYGSGEDGQHGLRDAAARTKLNQGFQVTLAGPVPYVDVKLIRSGTPVGNYWFTIESNSGGVPSGVALATSRKYNAGIHSTGTAHYIRIVFDTPATLSTATQYHLVMQGDYSVSGANYMAWRADTTAAGYASGSKAAYDGATWTNDTDDDFLFNMWTTENDTSVTLPTGYTRKALIGYVYNNSGSNFVPFQALNRRVKYYINNTPASAGDNYVAAVTANGTTQVLGPYIPPRPVILYYALDQDAASREINIQCLCVPTHINSGDPMGSGFSLTMNGSFTSGDRPTHFAPGIFSETQGTISCQSGGTVYLWVDGFEW